MKTVGIAGAGIAGRLVARELSLRGWRVTLVDKARGDGGAAYVAAGLLAPFAELDTADEPIAQLTLRSMALWPRIAPRAVTFGGSLSVATARDAGELERLAARVRNRHPQAVVALRGSALRELAPGLDVRYAFGLSFPTEGYVDNRAALAALDSTLAAAGVRRREGEAIEDMPSLDCFVDCRGIGAKASLPGLRGVRGEILRVHAPEVDLPLPLRCAHPRYPVYVVPRRERHYVIGATTLESEDESPPSVRSVLELLSTAYALHPGFGEARILEASARCRPAFPDNRPRLTVGTRVLRVNGLYRHGFGVGPEVARAVAALLDEDRLPDALLPVDEEAA